MKWVMMGRSFKRLYTRNTVERAQVTNNIHILMLGSPPTCKSIWHPATFRRRLSPAASFSLANGAGERMARLPSGSYQGSCVFQLQFQFLPQKKSSWFLKATTQRGWDSWPGSTLHFLFFPFLLASCSETSAPICIGLFIFQTPNIKLIP